MNAIENSNFWEVWAPYLSYVENNHLDLDCIRQLKNHVNDPVLVVGAGQGLIVEDLQKMGFKADGIELNPTMIEYAKKRRGRLATIDESCIFSVPAVAFRGFAKT